MSEEEVKGEKLGVHTATTTGLIHVLAAPSWWWAQFELDAFFSDRRRAKPSRDGKAFGRWMVLRRGGEARRVRPLLVRCAV